MGGSGSGRSSSYGFGVGKTHEYHAIDLAWLRRQKMLKPGRSSTLTWSRGGSETGSICVTCHDGGVRLIYRQRRNGGEWTEVNEFMPIVETPAQFGGRRQWFRCPSCHDRCRILYGGAHFRCRKCHRLRYESQYDDASGRACSQAHAIRKRLGQVGSLDEPFPEKPKGMHLRTYWRLKDKDEALLQRWAVTTWDWMRRFD